MRALFFLGYSLEVSCGEKLFSIGGNLFAKNFFIFCVKDFVCRDKAMGDLRAKLLEIQEYWLREARSRAGPGLKNVLDTSLGIIHGEAGEFVLEFLQNAEEALMEAGRTGFF